MDEPNRKKKTKTVQA